MAGPALSAPAMPYPTRSRSTTAVTIDSTARRRRTITRRLTAGGTVDRPAADPRTPDGRATDGRGRPIDGVAETLGIRSGGDDFDRRGGDGCGEPGIEQMIVERVFVGIVAVCHERPFEVKRFPEQMFAFVRSGC